jgi:hypothetical protein
MKCCRCLAVWTSAALAVSAAAGVLRGQERPVWRPGVTVQPTVRSWRFAEPLTQDSSRITGVSQLALPLGTTVALGDRWTLDLHSAWMRGTVHREGAGGGGGDGGDLTLDGFTDVRLRLVGRIVGDHVLLTLGANVPTGATQLGGRRLDALRILGAPALRFAVPTLGVGAGGTAGIVVARQARGWALAFGTSYEMRGRYNPIEASIVGGGAALDLDPGDALHLSVAADRLVGRHRLSLLVAGDVYGDDRLDFGTASGSGSPGAQGRYRLGPTLLGAALLDLAIPGYREFAVSVQHRYRTRFTGMDGTRVAGTSGQVLDAGLSTLRGRPGGVGFIARADGSFDTGLAIDDSFATAGAVTGGLTLGLSIPVRGQRLEPFVRGEIGRLDTGPESTQGRALTAGLTVGTR